MTNETVISFRNGLLSAGVVAIGFVAYSLGQAPAAAAATLIVLLLMRLKDGGSNGNIHWFS